MTTGDRRTYLAALLACLAGAGLTLYAVTRTWSLRVEHRAGLSDLRTEQTGADLHPWLTGLAVVALAGTGALLATRGVVRRGLGVLLTLAGAGIAVGALVGLAGLDAGQAGPAWPPATALGGAIIALGGLAAARHGHRWPVMSARYERRPAPASGTPASAGAVEEVTDTKAAWDALDRGDDPTVR